MLVYVIIVCEDGKETPHYCDNDSDFLATRDEFESQGFDVIDAETCFCPDEMEECGVRVVKMGRR